MTRPRPRDPMKSPGQVPMESPNPPQTEAALADRSILRAILIFGIPLVFGMGFHALFNLVDLWIVGKRGTAALAAVTIATLVNTVPMVICNGISTSSIALIARNIGFRNMGRANDVLAQSFLLVTVLSIVLGVVPFLYARDLVVMFQGKGEDVIAPATEYLQVVSLGTITMFLMMQITAALRAVGDGVWPLILLVGANLLNIVLDWALVFGKWGFPELGAPGAAYATVGARAVFVIIGLIVLIRGRGGLRLPAVPFGFRPRLMTIWRLVRIGMPASAQWVVRILAFLAILWIVGDHHPDLRPGFGKNAQAAFGVGLRLDLFAIFSGLGWGAAASTLVAQNLGRGRPDRAERATWIAMWLNVFMMVGMGIAYYMFAPWLMRFFGADKDIVDVGVAATNGGFEEVVTIGSTYLRVIVFSYVFIAVSSVLAQALNGAGSTRTPLVIDFIGLVLIQLPVAYFLVHRTGLGLMGVWIAIVVSNALISVTYAVLFRMGRWKQKEIW
jgi:putative MATE family efflux protein